MSQSPIASNVGGSSPVTVTATLDNNLNPGQSVYLRYTINNWSSSSSIEMTGNSTVYNGVILAQSPGTNVYYYFNLVPDLQYHMKMQTGTR
ncbi:MAG: hypothetical protein IPH57_03980 [Saprospiraceae bacterium]|nr:hypothetical protein [Saprospiraceae bacterium]